jgi:hypothetical protein
MKWPYAKTVQHRLIYSPEDFGAFWSQMGREFLHIPNTDFVPHWGHLQQSTIMINIFMYKNNYTQSGPLQAPPPPSLLVVYLQAGREERPFGSWNGREGRPLQAALKRIPCGPSAGPQIWPPLSSLSRPWRPWLPSPQPGRGRHRGPTMAVAGHQPARTPAVQKVGEEGELWHVQ